MEFPCLALWHVALPQVVKSKVPAQVLAAFRDQQLRFFVDGTLGAGGHSAAIMAEHPELQTLIGIDMDPTAHEIAKQRIQGALQDGPGLMALDNVRQVQVSPRHADGSAEVGLCNLPFAT